MNDYVTARHHILVFTYVYIIIMCIYSKRNIQTASKIVEFH